MRVLNDINKCLRGDYYSLVSCHVYKSISVLCIRVYEQLRDEFTLYYIERS